MQQAFRTWPARYKTSQIEIHETEHYHHWIASVEIRKVLPSLRPDALMLLAWLDKTIIYPANL